MSYYTKEQLQEIKNRVDSTDAHNRILSRARTKLRTKLISLATYEDIVMRLYHRKMLVLQLTDYLLHKIALERYL